MSATEQQDLFVKFPLELLDLVAAEKLTLNAAYLYMLLLTHINYKRGDAHVWPSRSSLAKRMRIKNAKSVDRYLDELVEAGLVDREHRKSEKNGNESNRYTLAVVCWPKREAEDPSDVQVTRAGDVQTPSLVTHRSPELDEPQLHELQPDQRSLSRHTPTAAASSVQAPQPREREAGFPDQKFPSSEHRILAKYGWRGKDADALIDRLTMEHGIDGIGWYITADKNHTLPDRIQELVDERLAELPDWVGPRPENGRWPALR